MNISVALVEDNADLRLSIQALIRGTPGFELAGAYASAEEALRGTGVGGKELPCVVLMDIHLPKLSGIECVRQLKTRFPDLLIIMFTVSESPGDVFPALAAGASGYLLKQTPPAQLLDAIQEVARQGAPMSPAIARMVIQSFSRGRAPFLEALTEREELVLRKLAQGWRYKEIAGQFDCSVETIHTHVQRLYAKLHVTSRTEAVVKYLGANPA